MEQPITQVFQASAGWIAAGLVFVMVCVLPARIIQTRHGYSPWLLIWAAVALGLAVISQFVVVVGLLFVPILVPLVLLWAFALSAPKSEPEALS